MYLSHQHVHKIKSFFGGGSGSVVWSGSGETEAAGLDVLFCHSVPDDGGVELDQHGLIDPVL